MNVYSVRDALLSCLDNVYHWEAPAQKAGETYAVWAETAAEIGFFSDNRKKYESVSGMIYLYTSQEYDKKYDDIVDALTMRGISIQLGPIGRDIDTGKIAYEIKWCVNCGEGNLY